MWVNSQNVAVVEQLQHLKTFNILLYSCLVVFFLGWWSLDLVRQVHSCAYACVCFLPCCDHTEIARAPVSTDRRAIIVEVSGSSGGLSHRPDCSCFGWKNVTHMSHTYWKRTESGLYLVLNDQMSNRMEQTQNKFLASLWDLCRSTGVCVCVVCTVCV